jgi:TatD DNase family protein
MSKKHVERIDPESVALAPAGIDSHAHLDGPEFDADREEVLARAKRCGLARIANVFLNPFTFPEDCRVFDKHPEVFFLLGVHPDDVAGFSDKTLDCLRRHVTENKRIRAIGEIGLDFSRTDPDGAAPSLQAAPFIAQLRLAKELDMPVAIHCRSAEEMTLDILEKEGFSGYPLVWHCFGADTALAERLVANDWYVSIPGTITFKNNPQARAALPLIADNRLMMETDCPYLSPVPWRGTRCEPAYTVFTIRTMAECRGVEPEALWRQCGENARTFYRLDEAF